MRHLLSVMLQFEIDVDAAWYRKFEVDPHVLPAVAKITRPNIRLLFYNIYKESKISDATATFTIDSLLLETFETIRGFETLCVGTPLWVTKLDELLHDDSDRPFSLRELSGDYSTQRGALVLHMLHKHLGDEKWWKAIRHYLKTRLQDGISGVVGSEFTALDSGDADLGLSTHRRTNDRGFRKER